MGKVTKQGEKGSEDFRAILSLNPFGFRGAPRRCRSTAGYTGLMRLFDFSLWFGGGLCLGLATFAVGQQPAAPLSVQETVTVLGAAEPVAEGENARSVETLPVAAQGTLLPELASALRADASVFVQQRGPMGVQQDISIRGGTFEQTLVLLNGLRINDAETSHFNFDIPVPMATVASLDVLHGTGSTLYGADALAGVIDVRTVKPEASELRLRAGVGSYGINQQAVTASGVRGRASEMLAAGRDFSTGFIADRDYRSESASSESRVTTSLGDTDLLLAGSDRAFGADQFYGAYPSYERTKGWFSSLAQALGAKTLAQVAYRRHSDIYVLFRDNPAYYKNQHIDESWQGAVRRHDDVGKHLQIFYGVEENTDEIGSNSLGHHGRNRGEGYVSAELRGARGSLTAGVREEVFSGGNTVAAPMFAGALRVHEKFKLRASAGYGYRIPTFVDLYYNDPTTISNPTLKPESAWNYDGGVDWYASDRIAVSVTGFAARQHDAIDYVRASSDAKYQAQNLRDLSFNGVEVSGQVGLAHGQQVRLAYTATIGAQDALQGLQSRFVFNQAVNNANAEWSGGWKQISTTARLGVTQRYQQTPFSVVDFSVARNRSWWRPYLQMTNLANTGYQEIAGIRNQGRAFVGGVELVFRGK